MTPSSIDAPAPVVSEQQEGPYVVTVYVDGLGEKCASRVASRKAFVTLDDDLRLYCVKALPSAVELGGADGREMVAANLAATKEIYALDPAGGQVTLPDGTVEVEKTTWRAIFDAIVAADPDAPGRSTPALPPDMWSESGKQAACRAFNAAQDGGAR